MAQARTTRYRDRDTSYAGVRGQALSVPSANPRNFHQAISRPADCPPVTIDAKLFVADSSKPDQPCVMVVPGSLGVGPNHEQHAETLVEAGFAVCVVDPFGPRSVDSTVANQTAYSFAASAWDVLATLQVLQQRPEIDATRIAAQGHSRGGAAVLTAATRRFADPIVGPDAALAAVYAVYPWCGQQFLDPSVGRTRVRAIIGEKDEWCSVQEAQGQVNAIRAAGAEATMRIVEGAQHSFDRLEAPYILDDASVAPNAPTTMISNDGAMINPVTGEADSDMTDRDVFLGSIRRGWGRRGAAIGGVDQEPALFTQDMLEFHALL